VPRSASTDTATKSYSLKQLLAIHVPKETEIGSDASDESTTEIQSRKPRRLTEGGIVLGRKAQGSDGDKFTGVSTVLPKADMMHYADRGLIPLVGVLFANHLALSCATAHHAERPCISHGPRLLAWNPSPALGLCLKLSIRTSSHLRTPQGVFTCAALLRRYSSTWQVCSVRPG